MNYLTDKIYLYIDGYQPSLSSIETVLIATLLSAVLFFLPFRRPLFWSLIQNIARFFYQKMNRQGRTEKNRKIRGIIVTSFFLLVAFFVPRSFLRFEFPTDQIFYIHIALLFSFISTGFVWRTLFQSAKLIDQKKQVPFLSNLIQDEVLKNDLHQQARLLITFAARSFDRFFIAPIFYYFLFGLYGLAIYATISAMIFSSSFRNQHSQIYAKTIKFIDMIVHFIPARLSAVLIIIASFLSKGSSGYTCLSHTSKGARKFNSLNGGWTISAFAHALNITLGGPNKQEEKSTNQPWVGAKDSIAKVRGYDIRRAAILHMSATLITFALLLTFNVFFAL